MLNVKVCTAWFVVSSLVLSGCATSVKPIEVTRPVAVSPINASADVAKRPPKIGLALGGGAARGFAHVGVIQVLEQHGIRPDLVVGTSAGSLVAALYASGKNGRELEQAALAMEEASLTDWTLPFGNRGMLRGAAVARYVSAQTQGKLIENMAIPLGIVATDLANGAGILFQRGDAGVAVRASSSVPGVFQPVDISSPPEANAANDLLKVMLQTFAIMMQTINRHELKQAHVLVKPDLAGVGSAAFSERQRSMAAGRAAMLAAMPKLKAQMAARAVPIAR